MHQHHDHHAHRELHAVEEPLDAANQSLADALKASFSILKGIMLVLVVLYLFSNVRTVSSHEQALLLRLGKLRPVPYDPGLVWAFPFPVDEIVLLPTKSSNLATIKSHAVRRRPVEEGKKLSELSRGDHSGLDPKVEGALLTADVGLVQVEWRIRYKIDDVAMFATEIKGKELEAAETLIQTLVDTVSIHVAGELTAEEMIRTKVDYAQSEIMRRVNKRLDALHSGVHVEVVEMYEPTPPLQVRLAFDRTQQSESAKAKRIREAKQQRTRILNEAAGSSHGELIMALDELDASDTPEARAKLDRILVEDVEGQAGQMIKDAGSYLTVVVGQMRSDLEEYRTLLPEFKRSPEMLVERLWENARLAIFRNRGVTKIWVPTGLQQFRIKIPLDPEQSRIDEERSLQKKGFDVTKLRKPSFHPIGPVD